jgi:hypothetical protein
MKANTRAVAGALLAVALAAALGCGSGPAPRPVPSVGSPEYATAVAAFYTGVAALKVDAPSNARTALTTVTQLVADEPAAWANLGLLDLRTMQFPEAQAHLERAAALAPDSAAIAMLSALLERRRGKGEAAVPHLRRALSLRPDDIKARYALVKVLDARPGPEAQDEARRLVDEILERAPANLVALVERARLAAKSGNDERFRAALGALRAQSKGWQPDSLETLEEMEKTGLDPQTPTSVLFLQQTLQPLGTYQESLVAVEAPPSVVGEPIERPLVLPAASPAPAPPDEGLTFESASAPAQGACSAVVVVWGGEGKPAVLSDAKPPFAGARALVGADLDGDFLTDVVACGADGLTVWTAKAGLAFEKRGVTPGAWHAAWPLDVELDGDLDLVVAAVDGPTAVLQNRGDGTLEAVAKSPFAAVKSARACAAGDLDGEGTADVALVDATGKLHVFLNGRGGRYEAVDSPGIERAAGVTCADTDGDGSIELLVIAGDGAVERCARRERAWDRAPLATAAGAERLFVSDLDNNGAVDLACAGGGQTAVFLSDGRAFKAGPAVRELGALAVADLDGDGRLDLAGRNRAGALVTAAGRGTKPYHWQVLRPRGNKGASGDKRINSFGVGGMVHTRAGLTVQTQLIAGPVVHIGLGTHERTHATRIVWPNGTADGEFDLKADQVLTTEQRLKGSCPWVFAYDGAKMGFVTDFLWRSPLGLKINAQDTAGVAQTEDRVKIRGDQLVARDGVYDVRITAELWETHFVDHVALLAVDHSKDVEVFVDERFAPRAPPVLETRAVSHLTAVAWAKDGAGHDVTADVRARDGRFLDVGRGRYQGVTDDHWVELPPPARDQRWLVAYGWIQPTDSSLNVAIAQSRSVEPRGLALEAKEADGTWRPVLPDLGFPAGKNKTVLIPLDAAQGRGLRLRTNLEIYWDQLSYARAAEAPAAVKRIAPSSAQLAYRGFSRVRRASASAPELPEYGVLAGTLPRWRDLEGFHTRFGEVRDLLAGVDDRYVIMNAGDELALRFPAPPPPPAGTVRDFVLVGDGWEKDGDFNTAFSRTVLPLPSHDAPAYDRPPGRLSEDPVYKRHAADWQNYHTRYVAPRWYATELR